MNPTDLTGANRENRHGKQEALRFRSLAAEAGCLLFSRFLYAFKELVLRANR
jgi:hypothetical protein